ncbi:sensor histidine kinase [Paenibacillus rigui]|uniref:histidine kinase n=1 Tax=Paenibacillus rigui TaxID=554312 RepID=A0A229UQ41_9BACL|nr:ATP-binding protein [Paenibacillus rigui]OXM85606.1 hypothetical protein CF651_14570 [Paenibacillus rigui]
MFEKTRKRLTFFFGTILAVILILVTVTYYLILQHSLQKNEVQELENMQEKMNRQWEHRLEEVKRERREQDSDRDQKNLEWTFLESDELVVLVNSAERIYASPSPYTLMSNQLMQWAQSKEMKISPSTYEINMEGKRETFLVGTGTLSRSGGTYWMAADITEDIKLLREIKVALFALTAVLISIASGLGYYFAGKAMIPVKKSYQQQVDFTTNASHELRTPLSVIHSSVELLEECKELLPKFEQHILEGLKDEVKRMVRLVESLLTLARGDAKKRGGHMEQVDLSALAYQVVGSMQPLAAQNGIQLLLNRQSNEALPLIQGNSDQLHQLLTILLDNALKYTPAGGEVTVVCKAVKPSGVSLQVIDTGIGIPMEELPNIFDRFYRVDKARSRELGGAGLGLSIAADIVKQLQAHIHVTSEEGKGSCFEVVFHADSKS